MKREINPGDFERTFAAHYVRHLTEPCTEELVRTCFIQTTRDLGLQGQRSDELWIKDDFNILTANIEKLRAAPSQAEARAIIFSLLFVH